MNICKIDGCDKRVKGHGYCNAHHIRLRRYGNPLGHAVRKTVEERFWPKVDQSSGPTGCWLWTAAISEDDGYGRLGIDGQGRLAHRISYELATGRKIEAGVDIDHICFNRICVNPSHLRPVTRKQNNEHRAGPNLNSKTGVRGVFPYRGHYRVEIGHNRARVHVGTFHSLEEAAEAARLKRIELFTHNDVDRAESTTNTRRP